MVFGIVWILKETRIDLKRSLSKKLKINILVVGGTGFIGKHLVHKLSKNKFNIFNLSKKLEEKVNRIKGVNYIFCDISKKKKKII